MNKLDSVFNFHQTSLRLLGTRQSVLASNIANEDTPNYKARDIPFAETLGKMLQTPQASQSIMNQSLQFRQSSQPSADGNTVDSNIERQQFTENSVRYEASIAQLRMSIKDLMAVLQS